MIESQIEQDLKTAMLSHDATTVSTLRCIKSSFLYAKLANGTRDQELKDEEAMKLLQKEAKKRDESAELYKQGGEQARADQELAEKAIIEKYLPTKLTEEELVAVVDAVIANNPGANMGQIIGLVKSQTAGTADGGDIARLVKEKL